MGRKILRSLLVLICLAAVAIGWIASARPLSMLLDRFYTARVNSRPITRVAVEGSVLHIDDLPFDVADNQSPVQMQINLDGRWSVADGAKTITLGERADRLGKVRPAPGETAQLRVERSILSWPTPLALNFMTGISPSWKRHLYYRLIWQRESGEKLEMTWRYEQWHYAADGWASGFMTHPGSTGLVRVAISP